MNDTKLVVVDGLPGSGKSTTAHWLMTQLHQNGVDAYCLQETDISHPLWWYEYWDGSNYLPPDFDKILVEAFVETSLRKWKGFVDLAKDSDRLYIAESVFFQNAVAMFLMGGAETALLIDYALEVQELAHRLNPALIYFRQIDVVEALRKICDLRGREFEEELFSNMERFPYLKQRELKGFDGVTKLWQEIHRLTDILFDEYTLPKLRVENSAGNWSSYQQQILTFLGLPPSKDEML